MTGRVGYSCSTIDSKPRYGHYETVLSGGDEPVHGGLGEAEGGAGHPEGHDLQEHGAEGGGEEAEGVEQGHGLGFSNFTCDITSKSYQIPADLCGRKYLCWQVYLSIQFQRTC